MNLTPHFTLEELTFSQRAAREGIDNTPDAQALRNLERTAEMLEQVRALLGGAPVVVSSGYRSQVVNHLEGGSDTSAHMRGLAADFAAPRFGTPLEICRAIVRAGLMFDQLIHEYGRWVHIGLSETSPRRQLLTKCAKARPYQSGIWPCI